MSVLYINKIKKYKFVCKLEYQVNLFNEKVHYPSSE